MAQSVRSIVLDEVDSTNTEALRRAEAGEKGPLWIVARRQTQGRGRSGRRWASEAGNLYTSLLQTIICPTSVIPQISLLAGVAVADAIRQAAGRDVPGLRLKWPNDVLIGVAKCAGILPESVSSAGGGDVTTVVGIGINLAWHPTDLGRPATHLAEHGVMVSPEAMLQALAGAMQRWLEVWNGGAGFAQVRAAWLERAGPIGERVTADTGAERIEGAFLDLDGDGALLLRDDHGLQRKVAFGEVALVEPTQGDRG